MPFSLRIYLIIFKCACYYLTLCLVVYFYTILSFVFTIFFSLLKISAQNVPGLLRKTGLL